MHARYFNKVIILPCIKCNISLVVFFPGSVEADVVWGGNMNSHLMASCVRNICAKNRKNPLIFLKVIQSIMLGSFFFWDTVYMQSLFTWLSSSILGLSTVPDCNYSTVCRCLHGVAPEYLSELCFPVTLSPSRYQLQSSQSNQLIVPPVKLSTYIWTSFVCCCWTIPSGTSYLNICVILNFQ